MVRIFSESVQSHPGRNARWRTYRYGVVALVVVARFCGARLVWMEISKLHHLANSSSITATDLFTLSQANGGRTALLRSHTIPAMHNVGVVLWVDCGFAFRHVRDTTRFERTWGSLARPRARRHRSIIRLP